jgi:protocatechuate 3,4-dioxygenase beta subunit
MFDKERRKFLQNTSLGLAAVGMSGLALRPGAQPTPATVNEEGASRVLIQMGAPPKEALAAKDALKKVPPMPYGPAYKPGAPFRAKLCPPFAIGTTFVMTGRVWAMDSKRPLAGVVIDLWHVDHEGKYSEGNGDFKNRGRLVTNEAVLYEFESIRPVPYQPNPNDGKFWRCAHFHVLAVCPGYKPLVTEIHFKDDPKQKMDGMYNSELAIATEKRTVNGKNLELGVFDIVLERDSGNN